MLITMDNSDGKLVYWPLQRGGGRDPQPLSGGLGFGFVGALAGDGDRIAMAVERPAEVAVYDVDTKALKVFADPFGTPVDIAVGKDHSLYAVNVATTPSVTMYVAPSHKAVQLRCDAMSIIEAVAVDDENDVFLAGYGRSGEFYAEIPNGPGGPAQQQCARLPLKGGAGYVGGIAIEPKTDALMTLDDPDLCAGGREGRLIIYPKPYDVRTRREHLIGVNCTGVLRLNADSTIVLALDTTVSEGIPFIVQRNYPDGGGMGIYHGGNVGGFTTIPNTLPN